MDPELSRKLVWVIPNRVLNILLSPGGHGKLARPVDFDDEFPDSEGMDFPIYYFVLLLSLFILPALLRYILGHVAPTLLILQVYQEDKTISEKTESKIRQHSSFRNVGDSFRLIYRAQGLYTFMRTMVVGLRVPFLSLRRKPGQNRWQKLAIPAFLYGLSQALMDQLYDFVEMALISPEDTYTKKRAAAEVLAVMIMLAFRLVALLPTYITLVLAETTFLSPEIDTIVPSPTKERGLKIGELVGEKKPPAGLEAFTNALRPFGTTKYLYLIELHLKKCFAQIILEFSLIYSILVSLHMDLWI
ncbi:uncharacterized protein N7498_004415 [Penicillium cinerascens]|uniref:Uncharacterized protein n=1 Tax=Penicillium cinerascens TaxID=70096 RepID=A0A9W9N4T6_9EURO|nr:uncharacterized protein N7498_004415 [Penicillium cinerascens]KAJ5212769.1 hypothetical protein N7498_004415 [Penicillium cinerascens]